MATSAADKLETVAMAIYKASAVGEERIRELKRKAQQERDEKDKIEGMFR